MSTPILSRIFSSLIKKSLGLSKSRICITGAASIPKSTLKWFDRFKIKIYEAYGMSENSACSHGNYPGNIKFGTVGKAMPDTDIKITDKGEVIMKKAGDYFNNEIRWKSHKEESKKWNKTIK